MPCVLNLIQKQEFDKKGFIIIKNFFDRKDSKGLITKMVAWNRPDDSIYGTEARSYKMVDTMEHLLEGEAYHYHSIITAKEPFEGGHGSGAS